MAITTGHDHNVGYYCCGLIPRRTVLEVIAVVVFLRYAFEILTWIIFARDLADRDRHPSAHCVGIRCPTALSCQYQHETTLLVRYALEVLFGIAASLLGFLGVLNWNAKYARVFGYWLIFAAGLHFVLGLADFAYVEICDAYPSNMVATMPIFGQVHGGRAHLRAAELRMVPIPEVDEVFNYDLMEWYIYRAVLMVLVSLFVGIETLSAAALFHEGQLGMGPTFKIADGFGYIHVDRRLDLRRLHYTEPVAGYGTVPGCYGDNPI